MDSLSRERRSANMRGIRNKDTKPELVVRRLLYAQGYRFRLHRKDLPGKPDIVLLGRRKVVFVHGCFWHQHNECREGRLPGSRLEYWKAKLERNQARDAESERQLRENGWDVLIVWECDLCDLRLLALRLKRFLDVPAKSRLLKDTIGRR